MPTKLPSLFTIIFTLITVLEILGDTMAIRWLHYTGKPLIMLLLLGFIWQTYRGSGYPNLIWWLLAGMAFALAGDVCLMIREADFFAPGLGAFLIMQLCYSRAFYLSIRQRGKGFFGRLVWPILGAFVLYDTVFLYLLHPAFVQNPALVWLWWPVVFYALCLSMMGFLATQRHNLPAYGWVVVGALLFILSDSLIAIDKFRLPIPGSTFFVMSTYATAQYLIILGMIRSFNPTVVHEN